MVTALHCLSYVSAVVGLIFVLLSLGEFPLSPQTTSPALTDSPLLIHS